VMTAQDLPGILGFAIEVSHRFHLMGDFARVHILEVRIQEKQIAGSERLLVVSRGHIPFRGNLGVCDLMLVASVAKVGVPVVVVSEAQIEREINVGVRLLKLALKLRIGHRGHALVVDVVAHDTHGFHVRIPLDRG
jgi:hypothetical protein